MASLIESTYLEFLELIIGKTRLTDFSDYTTSMNPITSVIVIQYNHSTACAFEAEILENGQANLQILYLGNTKIQTKNGFPPKTAREQLAAWILDIEEDIRIKARLRELKRITADFHETTEKFNKVKDTHPTREELDEIFSILDNLQSSIIDQLKEQQLKDNELEAEIATLKNQIEVLKSQAETSPSIKRVLGSMMQRLGKYITPENAQKVIEAANDVKGFLE